MKPKNKPSPNQPPEEPEDVINPIEEVSEEYKSDFPRKSFLQVGDITIGSSTGLFPLKRMAEELLKNKQIRNYLGFHKRKKLLMSPSYTD